MDLVIKQSISQQESVSAELVDKLYQLTKPDTITGQPAANAVLVGRLEAPAAYEDAVNFLNAQFSFAQDNGSDLRVSVLNNNYYIRFADSAVEETLKLNMGKDEGEGITLAEASNTVANYFQNNTVIENFDELKYFKTGSYIFRGCSALKSIDITGKESQVDCYDNKSIEYFYGINGPKGFLSTGCTGVDFSGCRGITTLELTCTSNTQVNSYRNMSGLQTLIWKVSPGVVLGSYTFYGASLLERVVVDDLDSFWTNNMGWGSGSPFQNKIAKLIVNDVEVTSVTVPQTISQIQPGNWCGARLTSCVFHSSVTSIGTHAFDGCDLLVIQDLNLPSLASLGSYAFKGTKVQTISDLGSVTNISEYSFKNCSQLTTIDQGVLDKITVLNKEAFNNCTSLGSAKQSDNTISSVLRLPNLTSIALDAVRYTKFTEIADLGSITTVMGFSEMYSLTNVVLPQTCTIIGQNAFTNDTALTAINLSNITSIGNNAFAGCTALARVDITDFDKFVHIEIAGDTFIPQAWHLYENNVLVTGTYTLPSDTPQSNKRFAFLQDINGIVFPSSWTFIPKGICSYCTNLTSATISEGVTEIQNNAFDHSGLTTIQFPSTIKKIGQYALSTTKIESVILPEGFERVGVRAFESAGKSNTTVWDFPSTLNFLDNNAFIRCGASYMIFRSDVPAMGSSNDVFFSTGSWPIYVPDQYVNNWKAVRFISDNPSRVHPLSELQ